MDVTLNPFHLHCVSLNNIGLSPRSGFAKKAQQCPLNLRVQMGYSTANHNEKVIVIMGGTGTGKSKLSVHLATTFSGEIINSDKIQVYKGLDISGNKISPPERLGVPHHLLGELDHNDPELTAADFRSVGTTRISEISSRGRLPIIAGGSNSFVYALLAEQFDPKIDVFTADGSVCSDLRFNCCFLWMDVAMPVLFDYLGKRIDEMLDAGLFKEMERYFLSDKSTSHPTLRKTIGVPEFEEYFRKQKIRGKGEGEEWELNEDYEQAVREMKENTCKLAKRQVDKILHLREAGWDIHRLDATATVKQKLAPSSNPEEGKPIYKRDVTEPSLEIVKSFLKA